MMASLGSKNRRFIAPSRVLIFANKMHAVGACTVPMLGAVAPVRTKDDPRMTDDRFKQVTTY
jgi:hypothetical protein